MKLKKLAVSIFVAFWGSHALAADRVQPQSSCEALAVAQARPVANRYGLGKLDLISISYIGPNREFNLKFADDLTTLVISSFITSGSRQANCVLSQPYILDGE